MIELSRKHGPFDMRWPTPSERAAARASERQHELRLLSEALAAETWDTDGGAQTSEPVAVRAAAA
jgi:hypothetical protein